MSKDVIMEAVLIVADIFMLAGVLLIAAAIIGGDGDEETEENSETP